MAIVQKYDLNDLSGSLNEGVKSTHIEDNEFSYLRNMYQFGPYLRRRNGVDALTQTAFAESLRTIFAYKKSTGNYQVLAGGKTKIGFLDGGTVTALPHVDGVDFTSSENPWSMVQYKDSVYMARASSRGVQRSDGTVVMDAGIPGPTTAPSAAQGSAGNLAAGDYKYVVTFLNRTTETEGDFSPVSAAVTLAASKRADVSSIPTSLNAQVNARNLYRTTANQSGEYFFVAQIADNFTTTYEDNVADEDLGAAVSLDNGLPPTIALYLEVWRQRLFVVDGENLWFSRAGFPEQFAEDFFLEVFPDDGHELRGVKAYGNRLLVGKTNKMHYVVGVDESDFELLTLSDKHGLASHHSMQVAEGVAFWFEGKDFFQTDGAQVIGMGRPYVQDTIDALTDSEKERMVSWIFPDLKWYCTCAPDSGVVFVANYKTRTWTIFEHGDLAAPTYVAEFADENFGRVMYAVFDDGHIYQWHTGNDDAGGAITCRVQTKSYGFDAHAFMKAVRRVNILTPKIAEVMTARLFRDQETSHTKEHSDVNLNASRRWKRLNISNLRKRGATVRMEFEYNGASDFEINALAFEMHLSETQIRPQ